jgi:hypothetical protein
MATNWPSTPTGTEPKAAPARSSTGASRTSNRQLTP